MVKYQVESFNNINPRNNSASLNDENYHICQQNEIMVMNEQNIENNNRNLINEMKSMETANILTSTQPMQAFVKLTSAPTESTNQETLIDLSTSTYATPSFQIFILIIITTAVISFIFGLCLSTVIIIMRKKNNEKVRDGQISSRVIQ